MFCSIWHKEPPLHQAVIDNDLNTIRELAKHKELKLEQNALGFTPLELAQYLQREEALALLGHHAKKSIKIELPDELTIRHFSQEEFYQGFGIKYLEHLYFNSYDAFKRAIHNVPWLSRSKIFGKQEQLLGRQYENEIKQGYTADLLIRWIDNTIGYGLFAETEIEEGAFIGEYTGFVRELQRYKPDPNGYCFHTPTKWFSLNYQTIDAKNEGNILRFMNHSDLPNVKPYYVIDRGLPHIIFLAKKRIKKQEQLTFDYGKDYWMHRTKTDVNETVQADNNFK